jgi:hypothetical protein
VLIDFERFPKKVSEEKIKSKVVPNRRPKELPDDSFFFNGKMNDSIYL